MKRPYGIFDDIKLDICRKVVIPFGKSFYEQDGTTNIDYNLTLNKLTNNEKLFLLSFLRTLKNRGDINSISLTTTEHLVFLLGDHYFNTLLKKRANNILLGL